MGSRKRPLGRQAHYGQDQSRLRDQVQGVAGPGSSVTVKVRVRIRIRVRVKVSFKDKIPSGLGCFKLWMMVSV